MTKSEKDIIYSINNKISHENVIYKNDGFYVMEKGVLQNFVVLINDTLFIRIDQNAYKLSKKVFKNFDSLDTKYTVCVSDDTITNLMISKGINKELCFNNCFNLIHLYDIPLMKIFDKKNIDFKLLFFNYLDFFDCFDEFYELVYSDLDNFGNKIAWKNVFKDRFDHTFNWQTNSNERTPNEIEKRELDPSEWDHRIMNRVRNKSISDLLSL